MEVTCRGPAFALELLPGVGGGVGSTAFLNTFAGFSLVINALERGIVDGALFPLAVVVAGGIVLGRVSEFEYTL